MNLAKIKFFIKLYWIRTLIITGVLAIIVSLVIFIVIGLRAWNEAESYLRQSQLAMIPLQLYLQIVMALIFGVVYTFMWYWLFMKQGAQSFAKVNKKAVAGDNFIPGSGNCHNSIRNRSHSGACGNRSKAAFK